jgi:Pyridoxamine 5'-phosphate oxidase
VTYQFRHGSVIFRTSPAGVLSGLVRRTSVAFEIDNIDEQNKSGWSVLVLGFAEGDGPQLPADIGVGNRSGTLGRRSSELVHRDPAAQDQRPRGADPLW